MGIAAVKLLLEREGELSAQRNNLLHEIIGRKYVLRFHVITTSFKVSQQEVLLAAGLPAIGSTYSQYVESDVYATCISKTAKVTRNPKLWIVECTFDTDRIVQLATDNPLNQPPDISWFPDTTEVPFLVDAYGTPVVSSSNNQFDPPLTEPLQRGKLTIVRNEASFDDDYVRQYINSLNAVTFDGDNPLYWKIDTISGRKQINNGIQYFQVTYEISYDSRTHCIFVLDNDTRDPNGRIFRDKITMQPLANPMPLNGKGVPIFDCVSELTGAISNSDTSIFIANPDVFPPALKPAVSGVVPGPYWNYKLRIRDEIVEVIDGHGTATLTVTRGVGGTVAVAHPISTKVKLEPYYLRFIPRPGPKDWTPLALPSI